jgi:hypothetical protein
VHLCYGTLVWMSAKSAVYRDRPRTLNELKTAVTVYVRDICYKQICRKCLRIKLNGFSLVSTLVDTTSNTVYKCPSTIRTHCTTTITTNADFTSFPEGVPQCQQLLIVITSTNISILKNVQISSLYLTARQAQKPSWEMYHTGSII